MKKTTKKPTRQNKRSKLHAGNGLSMTSSTHNKRGRSGRKGKTLHNGAKIKQAATSLLSEGRKIANHLLEDGMHRIDDVEMNVKEYSDELVKKVKNNPITSVLIAGGVGFIISKIMSR